MNTFIPLADRVRPKNFSEYYGQEHLIGTNGILTNVLRAGFLPSFILWGDPGSGKTTLARLISSQVNRPFHVLSAINSGVKELRKLIENAREQDLFRKGNPVIFIDEIHRFNKTQQDSLLKAVEKGWITLIGATTENPSFEVISALLSRCHVYRLSPIGKKDLQKIILHAIDKDTLLSKKKIEIKQCDALLHISGGDARRLLNALEMVVNLSRGPIIEITNERVASLLGEKPILFDKKGERYYDIISAFIKSIRGSDPNASVYWLARMLKGGQDVQSIARRMLILASEDIGAANPEALILANSTFDAVNKIGMPESRIILSQCAIYLATSPKSNSCYLAIQKAYRLVEEKGDLAVPLHLRNAPTSLMKELNYGKNYQYPHEFQDNFVKAEYMPKGLSNEIIYTPADNALEKEINNKQKNLWDTK